MSKLKPLHVAETLEELNGSVNSDKIKEATPRVLCRMGDKLLLKAKDESLSGDEELAYILYMRFLDAVKEIRKSKSYKRDKTQFDSLLPPRKLKEALDRAEVLSESLRVRYRELRSDKSSDDQVVPGNQPTTLMDSSSQSEAVLGLVPVFPTHSNGPPLLSPSTLFTVLTTESSQVIVIDCRPRASYNTSHPDSKKFPQWISVPEETVLKGLTQQSVLSFLRPSAKQIWKERTSKKYVVLVDEMCTVDKQSDCPAPIISLKNALSKWDVDTPLISPNPYILEGGYAVWYLSYAVTCVGVYRRREPRHGSEVKVSNVDSILKLSLEYPSFPDISDSVDFNSEPMNSEPMNSDPSAVSIDIDEQVSLPTGSRDGQTSTGSDQQYPTQSTVMFHRQSVPGGSVFIPTLPAALLPTYNPVPPASLAPPLPLSLEGESELFAPSLLEDFVRDIVTLEDSSANDDNESFGIVSEQAVITRPLPGPQYPVSATFSDAHVSNNIAYRQDQNQDRDQRYPVLPVPPHKHHNNPHVGNHGNSILTANKTQWGPNPEARNVVYNRVVDGPIPIPPTYNQSLSLPSLEPVHPPLPPPFSRSHDQSNLFGQNQQFIPVNQLAPNLQASPNSSNQAEQSTVNTSDQFDQTLAVKDAHIRQLEERLARSEQAIQEGPLEREEGRKKLEFESEKQRAALAEEVARQKQELGRERERAAIALEKEKQELISAREQHLREVHQRQKEFQMMKEQFDKERALMEAAKQQQLNQHLEQRHREEQQRVFSLQSGGLPASWEKRLDSTTGRFYYVDHDTKTTHWNPPTNWINYQKAREEENERKEKPLPTAVVPRPPQDRPAHPQCEGGRVPPVISKEKESKGQSVTPPIAKLPSIDRTNKPFETTPTQPVIPDRSKKPTGEGEVAKQPVPFITPAAQVVKKQNLQGVFGTGRHVLTGLRNLGNTCFLNSILQCLASTTPVIKYFLTGKYQADINYSNPLGSHGVVAVEFAWLMKTMWSGGYKYVSPRDFKDMIGKFVPRMKGNDQQDSQEFLAFLLDGLHEDLNKIKQRVFIEEREGSSQDDRQAAYLAWKNHLKRNDSIVVSYFQGMFRSSIKCNGCGKCSVTFEPFMYLSLPIPPGQGAWSLEDCIQLFIKTEAVEWNCSSCKNLKATKKMDIWRLPPVLLIHLKRFTYQGMWREKRQNTINYPTGTDSLNVSRFVTSQKGNSKYTLYAISNHFGTLTGGHYTACCRNPYSGTFYNFDDHDVTEALPRQVKSSAAYILYYTAIDFSPGRFEFASQ